MYSKLYMGYSALCKEIGEKGATKTRASSLGTLQFNSWIQDVPLSLQMGRLSDAVASSSGERGEVRGSSSRTQPCMANLRHGVAIQTLPEVATLLASKLRGPSVIRQENVLIFFKVVSDNVSLQSFFFLLYEKTFIDIS